MPQLNNAQARVIDPVLTNVALGFKHTPSVGGVLFPSVPVDQRGGKIISFSKEDFMLYNTGRAPGQNTKRVQFGYGSGNYVLESHSLEGTVPIETMQEVATVPGIDAGKRAIYSVQASIAKGLEQLQASLSRNAALYAATNKIALTGTSQFNDAASDPVAVIENGKEQVRKKIGVRPNTIVIAANVMNFIRQHPKIVDRIKYTGRDIATNELLASLFGVTTVVEGSAVMADDNGAFSDVWGKDIVMAYTEVSDLVDMGQPSYGYTYQLRGYPFVEEAYYERNPKSWIYPVTDERAPVIATIDAGYLIQNAVA